MWIGILIALFLPGIVPIVSIFGDLFVKALKGVALLLVFILVMNAMVQRKEGGDTNMKPIITLYVIGTFAASITGRDPVLPVPQTLVLQLGSSKVNPQRDCRSGPQPDPEHCGQPDPCAPDRQLHRHPGLGGDLWHGAHTCAGEETKQVLENLSQGITKVVTWVIHLAPPGHHRAW